MPYAFRYITADEKPLLIVYIWCLRHVDDALILVQAYGNSMHHVLAI